MMIGTHVKRIKMTTMNIEYDVNRESNRDELLSYF